jgi:hypothetical protein
MIKRVLSNAPNQRFAFHRPASSSTPVAGGVAVEADVVWADAVADTTRSALTSAVTNREI